MDEKNNVGLSPDEITRILALPIRKVQIGGIVRRGHFDERAQIIYQIDENGKLNGQVSRLKKTTQQGLQKIKSLADLQAEREREEKARLQAIEEESMKKNGNKLGVLKSRLTALDKKKTIALCLIAVAVVICIVVSVFLFAKSMIGDTKIASNPEKPAIDTTANIPENIDLDENGNIILAENEVAVVRIAYDLVSGDVLTEEVVEPAIISIDAYNQLSFTSDTTIYKYDRLEDLLGLTVVKYMNAGQYLCADSVSDIPPTYTNPWGNIPNGYTYVDVPIQEEVEKIEDYLPGTIVHLYFMNDGQSSTVDNLLIANAFNSEDVSVIDSFNSLFSIPVGDRSYYFDEGALDIDALISKITPATLRVIAPADVTAGISDLVRSGATVKIEATGKTSLNQQAQEEFYTSAVNIATAVRDSKTLRAEQAQNTEE